VLIPPFFIHSVVALGEIQTITVPGQPDRAEWVTTGTGFFYGDKIAEQTYQVFLVTARHVVQGFLDQGVDAQIRINPTEAKPAVKEFTVPRAASPGVSTWFFHPDPDIDVAAVPIDYTNLQNAGFAIAFFFK
jgi:hypothetical protein